MPPLSREDARDLVIDAIGSVAPDVADEVADLDRSADVWHELQLDSMDHLNAMTEIGERTGVEIEERLYSQLRSIDALAGHLAQQSIET